MTQLNDKSVEAIKNTSALATWLLEPKERAEDLEEVALQIFQDIGSQDDFVIATGFAAVFFELLSRLSEATGHTREDLWQSIAMEMGERFSG